MASLATLMLGTVYDQIKDTYNLKLLAGEKGLHRSLRWMYFSEDIGNALFFRGGELMLLTGHKFKTIDEFEDFVKMLMDRNACGVIIPVGKYIQEENISKELLALCDENQFPLLTMPWKYHFTDFMQSVSRYVFSSMHEQDQLAYAFQMLLKHAKLYTPEDEALLRENQYALNGEYCVAVLACQSHTTNQVSSTILQNLKTLIENHLNQWPEKIFSFLYQGQVILIFHDTSCRQIGRHVSNILRFCEQSFPAYTFFCGIGSPFCGIEHIKESFDRARAAIRFGIHDEIKLMSFDTMGLHQLLFYCQDPSVLHHLTRALDPLTEYDLQNNSQLVETLRLYIQCDGSVNQVSEEMFCHRNTTNYRVKKIKSILGSDLEDSKTLFRLQMAFFVLDYQRVCADTEQ